MPGVRDAAPRSPAFRGAVAPPLPSHQVPEGNRRTRTMRAEAAQGRERVALTARDIMTTSVVSVSPTMTVEDLARVLAANRISGAPVVDQAEKLLGIVSELDVLGVFAHVLEAIE